MSVTMIWPQIQWSLRRIYRVVIYLLVSLKKNSFILQRFSPRYADCFLLDFAGFFSLFGSSLARVSIRGNWFDFDSIEMLFFFFDEWQLHDGLIFQCEAARENESIVGADDESRIWVKCLFFSTSQSIFFSYGRLFHFVFCFSLVGLEATAGAICKWRHCKWRRPKIKNKKKERKRISDSDLVAFLENSIPFLFFFKFLNRFWPFFSFFFVGL